MIFPIVFGLELKWIVHRFSNGENNSSATVVGTCGDILCAYGITVHFEIDNTC